MARYAAKRAKKLSEMDKSKILVFDTETTGTNPDTDEILQITILDGYGRTLFSSYIRPTHRKRWPNARKTNHISYQMVADKPTFSDVRAQIQALFNNARLIVGYNVNFDINFVREAGIVPSGMTFDVMREFARYRSAVEKTVYRTCKLKECAQYFGVSFDPHNSAADAAATLACFNGLIDDPRFVASKPKPKQPKSEAAPEPVPKRKTSFTLQMRTPRRRNAAIYGILLMVFSEIGLYISSGAFVTDFADYLSRLKAIPASWDANCAECILCILLGIGLVLIVIGVIRFLLRLPRIISAKIMHFINRFH